MSAICGFLVALIIMLGIPTSIILLTVFAIKKKGVKIPLCCLGGCVLLIITLSLIGSYSYQPTDDYQDGFAYAETEETTSTSEQTSASEPVYNMETGINTEHENVTDEIVAENKEVQDEGYTVKHVVAIAFLIGFFFFAIWFSASARTDKTPKYNGQIRKCPQCGGSHFHAFVENEVVIPGKVKSKTTLNMNPLKPFTVFNHKEKVVRREVTRQVSKFVCDDCGNIFQ